MELLGGQVHGIGGGGDPPMVWAGLLAEPSFVYGVVGFTQMPENVFCL